MRGIIQKIKINQEKGLKKKLAFKRMRKKYDKWEEKRSKNDKIKKKTNLNKINNKETSTDYVEKQIECCYMFDL